ncbi:unnamed protein product [Plutella xylostella]|uniref:(diamondback moth) hypothetical protein n=1 Tax=Plutella xylostella TaxID=51655 RepID=A0A8S4E942_PLUXY|nr:unnamed protein product [Plutella xylostella]
MCEDKEEVRGAGEGSPRVPCWRRRAPAPLPDTRGLCCAKLLRKNGKPKKGKQLQPPRILYGQEHFLTVY